MDVNRFDGTNLLSESSFAGSTSDEMLDGSPVTFDTGVVERIHSLCVVVRTCIEIENSAIESVDQLGIYVFKTLWAPWVSL